jgi:hypothetical protein
MKVHALAVVCCAWFATAAHAQVDISGEWANRNHEDAVHRGAGADVGDYTGLPINAAARQKANHWDASILSLLEHMAKPHSAHYFMRGPGPNIRVTKVNHPVTQALMAFAVEGLFGRGERVIWMDGRPHPPKNAEHMWSGYSTGRFAGNQLIVTTTHIKAGVIQRNGVATSAYATMTERFIRHGDHMILLSIVNDPYYLEEPLVRTSQWVRSTSFIPDQRYLFEVVEEVAGHPRGYVPHYPFGTVPDTFAKQYGIPLEAAMGGRQTLYPEYESRLRQLIAGTTGAGEAGRAAGR